MPKQISESLALNEATRSSDTDSGLLEVEFITPGWGSSGYYSREVVEAAAPLFAEGTHMYFDHPTDAEAAERPGRSVRDLAAVIAEAGTVDKATGGIRGKVKPLAPYRELLTDEAFAKNVGLSIRGSATDIVVGEAEGRKGPIVEGLADVTSVDFVTRAGRGGKVLQVLESARLEEQALHVDEATASDRMGHLRTAVRTAHGTETRSVWVRDQDAEKKTVWFDVHDRTTDAPGQTFQQRYTVGANDVDVVLTGKPVQVSPVTQYVPVTRPDSTNPTTEADQEVTMGNIQIEESEHKRLVEKAGRVDALEAERDTEKARADKAEAKLAEQAMKDRNAAASKIIAEQAAKVHVAFTPDEVVDFVLNMPVKEDALDVEAFTKTVAESAAKKAEDGGAGSITGFGGQPVPGSESTISEADLDAKVGAAFGRPVKEA